MITPSSSRLSSNTAANSASPATQTDTPQAALAPSQPPAEAINTAGRQALTRQSQRAQNFFAYLRQRELDMPCYSQQLDDLAAIEQWQVQTAQAYSAQQAPHIAQLADLFRQHAKDLTKTKLRIGPRESTILRGLQFVTSLPPIPAHITELNVMGCFELETIDLSRCKPQKLQSVKVTACGLKQCPDLKPFGNLKHLNLSFNWRMRDAVDVSKNPKLETLLLNNSRFLTGLSDLSKNPELTLLSLNEIRLFATEPMVLGNPKLKKISLCFCPHITQLPNFKACPSLEILDMRYSNYPNLPDDLNEYPESARVLLSADYDQFPSAVAWQRMQNSGPSGGPKFRFGSSVPIWSL